MSTIKEMLTLLLALMILVPSVYSQDDNVCATVGGYTATQYVGTAVNLKILLVQFTDVTCKELGGVFPKFTKTDFEEALGSNGIYASPNRYTPDGDAVYGSLNDYFRKMSSGNVTVTATLLNHVDDNRPVWLNLDGTKAAFHAPGAPYFYNAALAAASNAGITIGTLDDYNKLVIIYAGNRYNRGELNPVSNGTTYIMSELENAPMNQEHVGAMFARIGTHCHEFAHCLGIKHSTGSRADLMQAGNRNGNYAAPAPLNPVARAGKGWLSPIPISGTQQFDAYYSLTAPEIFKISSNYLDEYFLVENRHFDETMTIGSMNVPDYNHKNFMPIAQSQNTPNVYFDQGIMVWRVTPEYPNDDPDRDYNDNGLVYASGRRGFSYPDWIPTETDAGDLFPGSSNNHLFTPWTDPRDPYLSTGNGINNLYVPNTKAGTNVAMQVVSEDPYGGTFQLYLYASNPPNPASSNQSTSSAATSFNGQRKLFREGSGILHEVFEHGGEVIYRKSTDGGSNWHITVQITNGWGYHSSPCVAMAGSTGLVALQHWTGTAYEVMHCRSTDAGTTWLAPVTLDNGIECSSPGPLPTISGYSDGSVFLCYRTSSGLRWTKSTNGGIYWSPASTLAGTTGSTNMPSSAINTTYWSAKQANIAYATELSDNSPRIHCNYYDFQASSWGTATDLCSVLPGNYIHHANPSLAVSASEAYKTVHVAWDAEDTQLSGTRVLIHREGGFRNFPGVYSMLHYQSESEPSITGVNGETAWMVYQNASGTSVWKRYYDGTYWAGGYGTWVANGRNPQISVGSSTAKYIWTEGSASPYEIKVSTEGLSKAGDMLAYSRALNAIDTASGASISLEIGTPVLVYSDGRREEVPFAESVVDSFLTDITGLLKMGQSSPFAVPREADSLCVPIRISGIGRGTLLSETTAHITLNAVESTTGLVLKVLTDAVVTESALRTEASLSVPVRDLAEAAGNSLVQIQPEISGIATGAGTILSLGHMYRKGGGAGIAKDGKVAKQEQEIPTRFLLHQNYPNPFNPSTRFSFDVAEGGYVSLTIHDVLGREVAKVVEGYREPRRYTVEWNAGSGATTVSSGVYLARLQVKGAMGRMLYSQTTKIIAIK